MPVKFVSVHAYIYIYIYIHIKRVPKNVYTF